MKLNITFHFHTTLLYRPNQNFYMFIDGELHYWFGNIFLNEHIRENCHRHHIINQFNAEIILFSKKTFLIFDHDHKIIITIVVYPIYYKIKITSYIKHVHSTIITESNKYSPCRQKHIHKSTYKNTKNNVIL